MDQAGPQDLVDQVLLELLELIMLRVDQKENLSKAEDLQVDLIKVKNQSFKR